MKLSGILIIVGLAVLYFMPAMNAYGRRHKQRSAICLTNALLGWTVLGWVVALIWSVSANVEGVAAPAAESATRLAAYETERKLSELERDFLAGKIGADEYRRLRKLLGGE